MCIIYNTIICVCFYRLNIKISNNLDVLGFNSHIGYQIWQLKGFLSTLGRMHTSFQIHIGVFYKRKVSSQLLKEI